MALMHCNFFSDVLGVSSSMYVIIPQNTSGQIGMEGKVTSKKHPTLYLLHGLSDDHTIWLRRTSIERYVAPLGLAVVMPAVNRSFYTDMKHGYRYWTFISEELPELARSFFPLSDRREDNFVAGLSMGGYGALKLALRCPNKFAAAASLSGVTDIVSHVKNETDSRANEMRDIFGSPDTVKDSEDDLYYLAKKVSESIGPKPKLYLCCGTEDPLYKENVAFRDYCKNLHLDITYEEGAGEHEWGFWDMYIQNVLKWLPTGNRIQ